MEYIEFTGKTVEEAVEKGLQELGLTKETADIRVLEEGKRKLFGSVKARVESAPLSGESKIVPAPFVSVVGKTDGERAVEFLEGLFKLLKITACTELMKEDAKIEINVTASNSLNVIGKHGVMLDAIQTLAGAVANTGREDYKRVVVDCENYRESREATLQKLADNLAQKATRIGKKIKLEPMNPYERRIIHSALAENETVKTESEGKEPNRYIVIIPSNVEDETAEPIPARVERHSNRRGNGRSGGRNTRNSSRSGGFNRDKKAGYNRRNASGVDSSNAGGTTLKNTDFFGIFLGNSGKNDKE